MKIDIRQSLKELKSYNPIGFKSFIISDNLIHEPTATEFTENSTAVLENVSSLQKLLKIDFALFLRNIAENEKLIQFLESYLTYRSKPFLDVIATPQSSLFLLDKLVSLVFYRLTIPQNEHHLLPYLLPRPHFTVHKAGKFSIEEEEVDDKKQLDEQYKQYLQTSIRILKFPYLLNLIGIMGESNTSLRSELYLRTYQLVETVDSSFLKEIHRSIQETQKACSDVLINIWQLYSTMENTQKEVTASMNQTKKSSQNMITKKRDSHSVVFSTMKELHHLLTFMVDIVYSWHSWLQVVDKQWLIEESGFFSMDGVQLSKLIGHTFYELLQLIFEPIVSMSMKVLNSLQSISSSTNESLQTLVSSTGMRITCHEEEKVEYGLYSSQLPKCISLIQYHSFKIVHKLISSANEEMHARKHAKGNSTYKGASFGEGKSWLEVWSQIIPIEDHLFAVDLSFITAPSTAMTSTAPSKSSAKQGKKNSNSSVKDKEVSPAENSTSTINKFFHLGTLISDYIKFATKYISSSSQPAAPSSKSKKDNSLIEELIKYTLALTMGMDSFEGNEGESILQYYLQTLQVEDTSLLPVVAPVIATEKMSDNANVSKKASAAVSKQSVAEQKEVEITEKIQQVQNIFPDYGKGYIEACLKFYNFKTEEVIDAMLTNNVHPSLSQIDKRLEKIWIGKQSLNPSSSNININSKNNVSNKKTGKGKSGKAAEPVDEGVDYKDYLKSSIPSNQEFQALQKKILAEQERQRMYDAYVIEKEYNDDYDDTFDEIDCIVKPAVIAAQQSFMGNKQQLPKRGVLLENEEEDGETIPAKRSETIEEEEETIDKETLLYEGFNDEEISDALQSVSIQPHIDTSNKSTKGGKKGGKNSAPQPKEDWKQQMQDVRRYNTLLRQEESEVKFWEDMQNTNHTANRIKSNKHSWKEDVKEAERIVEQEEEERQQQFQALRNAKGRFFGANKSAPSSSATTTLTPSSVPARVAEPPKSTVEESSRQGKKGKNEDDEEKDKKESGGKGNSKKSEQKKTESSGQYTDQGGGKHRTKHFDAHHQKARAVRKFGGF